MTELAEDLVRICGCEVSIVAGPPLVGGSPGKWGFRLWPPFRVESIRGVQVFRTSGTVFKPHRFAGRAINYMSYFVSACLTALRIPQADVVFFQTDPPIIGLAALLASRRGGARFVFVCQDVFPEVARLLDGFRNEWIYRALDRISRYLIRKADRVVALGEKMRERLIVEKGADPKKVVVIHNWVDCSAILSFSKKNPFSLTHGLANSFVVMHSGNMGICHSLETLVRSITLLKDIPDLILVFIGEGVKKSRLQALVHDLGLTNVRFLPYEPKENLSHSFSAADCFVISLEPGLSGYIMPSKLYGILAAGRPYIASVDEECDVARITRQNQCGLLAKPGNAQDLADKIRILYKNRSLAQEMGARAREAAFRFDRAVAVKLYFRLCCELAGIQLTQEAA
ncbi:MAG: glycosyltransferase family 4 protein [Candidatus Omnitrophica bacterium]|nr:glycosyltransferase family 4 protein [Candidatus Omnitrophota bacterium]